MKKEIKFYSPLFKQEVTFIMSDKPSPPPSKLALRKVAEVNEYLSKSKYKNVEEMLQHAKDSSPE